MKRPGVEQSKNVEYVGYSDLNGKHPFKEAIQKVNDRWYLYVATFDEGWSIIDVTDPAKPEPLNFIKGPSNTFCIQVTVAEGKMLTGLQGAFLGERGKTIFNVDPAKPWDEGVLIWDVASSPTEPKLLGQFKTGGFGTHRNVYTGGKYAHLAANMKGYEGNIPVTIDISDPANPVEVGRWHYPGQWVAGGESQNGKFLGVHGPIEVVGDVAYLPYAKRGFVILDYSDLTKPKMLGHLDIGDFAGFVGIHSAMPIPERDLVIVTTEASVGTTNINGTFPVEVPKNNAQDNALFVVLADVSNPREPHFLSHFPIPIPEDGLGYRSFAKKGGAFGPHNTHHYQNKPEHARVDNIIHLCYFNAGLRIIDISEPTLPREVGYFVPENPKRNTPVKLTANFDDVLVDSRGYAFCLDRHQGLFVLRYTG